MLVEVCVSSILSIQNAAAGGADRIELCAALEVGGLTPSWGFIKEAVALEVLPIHCLIRPRQGHFTYSKSECNIIEQDIVRAKKNRLRRCCCRSFDFGFYLGSGSIENMEEASR